MTKIKWTNITREHVIEAIEKFNNENLEYPSAKSTFLIYDDKKLPAKHIRGMSYKVAYREEVSKENFSGGKETVRFFERLGFEVIDTGESNSNGDIVELINEDEITSYNENEIDLKELLIEMSKKYEEASKGDFAGSEVGRMFTRELPRTIVRKANIDSAKYKVEASIGKGQFAEIPCVAILRKNITESATKGIYIVYLYTADRKGIYLSLNQGFTVFKEKFGTKKGRVEIGNVASFLQSKCNTINKELKLGSIDLGANGILGKGYEPGHIAGKYYDVNDLPTSNKLADDLRNLMSVYEEIIGMVGNRTIDQFYDFIIANENGEVLSDDELLINIEEVIDEIDGEQRYYTGVPREKKEAIKDNGGAEKYPRDKKTSAKALDMAKNICENNKEHISFIRKVNGKNYTEPHHLIPINAYKDFQYSLDIEENIVSLCSTCHNCLHYGIDIDREKILEKIYEERKERLTKVGLEINFSNLKKYYNIK